MNKALISIGTNIDKESNMTLCRHLLNNAFTNIKYSETSITKPYGDTYKNNFLNQLALVKTRESKAEVSAILKSLEKDMGRSTSDKEQGIVIIDIDLVIWNEEILKPEDITRNYITDLLSSL